MNNDFKRVRKKNNGNAPDWVSIYDNQALRKHNYKHLYFQPHSKTELSVRTKKTPSFTVTDFRQIIMI